MGYPFRQKRLDGNTLLREFSKDVDSEELVWHRDKRDRVVQVMVGEGWMFQRDNSVPVEICEGDVFKIKAGQYHRLLKGDTDLVVRIFEQQTLSEDITTTHYVSGAAATGRQDDKGNSTSTGDKGVAVVENDVDEDAFTYKVAKAALDDKKKIKIGDKEHPVKMSKKKAKEIVGESTKTNEPSYSASRGSKRAKKLDATKEDLERAKKLRKDGKAKQAKELEQRAYRRRERMEKQEREKPGYKNKPRKDTKKESIRMAESDLREVIRNILSEELSKKTKETLKKKAEKRGLTPGSVYAEFRKGIAAFNTSGSKKGKTAQQWAHARVNSATPSKPWAVVKKSKAKKKK